MESKLLSLRNRIGLFSVALFLLCAVLALCFAFGGTLVNAEAEHPEFEHDDCTAIEASTSSLSTGNYCLEQDVVLESTLETVGDVVICLNGHTLSLGAASGSVIRVNSGTLKIYDCVGGGQITGGKAQYGGGIECGGNTLYMYGGNVTENSASEYGGGVNVSYGGRFYMYGGSIINNTSNLGGGVSLSGETSPSFYMYGGSITNNTAVQGGGVYMNNANMFLGSANNEMSVIDITQNNNDVYLDNNDNCRLIVNSELAEGTQIGISLGTNYTGSFAAGYGTYNSVDPSNYFICNNGSYYCTLSGGAIVFSAKSSIDINDAIIDWTVDGSQRLSDGTVYILNNAAYLTEQAGATAKTVKNSIAHSNGQSLTVEINTGSIDPSVISNISYSNNTGSDNREYTTVATIKANSAYSFSRIYAPSEEYGISVISSDESTVVISKTWYIAIAENDILNSEKTGAYAVTGWTFGDAVTASMPKLKYGSDADNAKIKFTLSADSDVIADEANIEKLPDYINSTMPSGRYTLTLHAPDVTVDDMQCAAFDLDYVFTVGTAEIDLSGIVKNDDFGYGNYEWKFDEGNKSDFFGAFVADVTANISLIEFEEKQGYWADRPSYYGAYNLTYNFARIYDNNYRASGNVELLNAVSGGSNGTYKVYFRITAPNHTTIGEGDARYGYFFTVTVYEEQELPTVTNVIYTGARNIPAIAADPVYAIEYDGADGYIDGGIHTVSLKLLDPVHYRWADGIKTSGEKDEYAEVSYEILPITNTWMRTPNIVGWEYGSYSSDKNYIVAIPNYGDARNVKLSVAKDENGTDLVEGLESFGVDADGNVSEEVNAALGKLGYGTYWLIAEMPKTNNYTALAKQSASFNVSKTVNYWTKSLSIVSWVKGEYDPETNLITAQSHVGDIVIVITDLENGTEYYNSKTGVDELAAAPIGLYKLTATVESGESYSALSDSIEFRIFDAATVVSGFPWWAVLLIVLGIVLIVLLILFILYKKGIFQLVSEKMVVAIRTRADTDATIAAVRAGKIAAEAERSKEEARLREEALAAEQAAIDAASDEEEAQPEIEEDEENPAYEPEEDDVEVPSSEGFEKAFAASSGEEISYAKTVLSKLISAPDVVKTRYSDLKNYLLGFKKARANMSRSRETFYLGRKCYARIAVRGKTMCLYLALNPADCADKYNVEDVLNVKAYVDTPCLLRIRSERALRYAKELIDQLMSKNGAVKIDRKPENYAELFRSIELLEKKNLLSYGVKKKKSNNNNFNKGDK